MRKKQESQGFLKRAMASGTISGLATATAALVEGKRETGSYYAPLNATSHIIWGDEAALQDSPSLKYTLTGFLLNHASAIFWAFYEKWFGRGSASEHDRAGGRAPPAPLAESIFGAATVTTAAYVIDYHLIPKRFTPGFEKRLSPKSLATIFVTLAIGLAARDLIGVVREKRD
jgi:hypothetical protein